MSVPAVTQRQTTSTSISTGATGLSGVIALRGRTLSGIGMSTAWTGAVLSFQAATSTGGTFRNIYTTTGGEVTMTTTASRHLRLNPSDFAGIDFLKIRSGKSTAAVAQGKARTLQLFCDVFSN